MAERVLRFQGRLMAASFLDFARHRAARLDLTLRQAEADGTVARLHLAGAVPLLDAFELACSLGPLDCLVLEVAREAP
jgi:hypothetical protein